MLTPEQKQVNSDTWRHIWHVQRFLVSSEQYLIRRSLNISFFHCFVPMDQKLDCIEALIQCASGFKAYGNSEKTCLKMLESVEPNLDDIDIELFTAINNNTLKCFQHWIDNTDCEVVRANEFPYLIYHSAKVLTNRCVTHDQSKLCAPEVDTFCEYTPRLKEMQFGSDEYKQCLAEMKPALDNHYAHNRHHPEHYENGVYGMTWFDVIEMCCDWAASSKRTKQGSFAGSVEICKERFKLGNFFSAMLVNTYDLVLDPVYDKEENDYLKQGLL